ncbi:MAG: methyltransferase [Kiritimatiellia bacterium]|jgi:predicted O-methyltransferase YrrM|nr:methyltransferase [Kiritimatiellia bacterium]MDX9792077.1 methyltransferase [Kiritimatiellia bacterium]NLC80405.1 methyltransferase domain-containing protein [Lentisphaerota bacterium]
MKKLGRDSVLELVRGFQPSCVVIAGAELDVFTILHDRPMAAAMLARRVKGDVRAVTVLLDALAAIGFLDKSTGAKPLYSVPPAAAEVLAGTGKQCMLGMVRHLGNCLRGWGHLAGTVLSGKPAKCRPSVLGAGGDLASFIRAMHEISEPMAMPLVAGLGKLKFTHVLDLGGASGTWTVPFLRVNPGASATIMDRPDVIPMARRLMRAAGLTDRVRLVPGDFMKCALPEGADLVWVSAIVHQNSRAQNRRLFAKVFSALEPGGLILIRDIVMDASRTRPAAGAMFAVNMLVNTPGGGTFTFDELREDLSDAGFTKVRLLRRGLWMDSVVGASKPLGKSRRKA